MRRTSPLAAAMIALGGAGVAFALDTQPSGGAQLQQGVLTVTSDGDRYSLVASPSRPESAL